MNNSLAKIYSQNSIIGVIPNNASDYFWYIDITNEPIGICKNISESEKKILDLHYTSINIKKTHDIEKLLWLNFLTNKNQSTQPNNNFSSHVNFLFFYHDLEVQLRQEFEALFTSFNPNLLVLFLEANYGVCIDVKPADNQEDIADFLQATKEDFSNELQFYQTHTYEFNQYLSQKFLNEFEVFKRFKKDHLVFIKPKDLFINYLVSTEVVSEFPIFGDWFLSLLTLDAELLLVVKTYLENGFNVTTGSKIMHMHRNTFMNKLDRFIEITGLDVKNFDEAAIAYLLMHLRRDV